MRTRTPCSRTPTRSCPGHAVGTVADDLRTGIVQDSLADVQLILTVLFVLLVAWTAVPAAGALWIGWWLRRELRSRAACRADRRASDRRASDERAPPV